MAVEFSGELELPSRMMKRLSDQGLVEDAHAHAKRLARAWRLTMAGEAVIGSHEGGRDLMRARRRVSKGGKLVLAKNICRGQHQHLTATRHQEIGTGFRVTALTREELLDAAQLVTEQTT